MRKRERKRNRIKYVLGMCVMLSALCLSRSGMLTAKAATVVTSGNCGTEGHESDVTWTLDDEGVLTISGTGDMKAYYWPNYAPWYDKRESIKTIAINSGVTSIGNYAFYKCSNLTSITIPDSVTSIGDYAFYECSNLTSITIPDDAAVDRLKCSKIKGL